MDAWLRRLEQLLTVTPQRMRMIVDGFIDVLEQGLEKPGQMVVSATDRPSNLPLLAA